MPVRYMGPPLQGIRLLVLVRTLRPFGSIPRSTGTSKRRETMRKVFPYVLSGLMAASFSQIAFAQSTPDNSPRQNRGVQQTPGDDVRQEDRRADRRDDRDRRADDDRGRHGHRGPDHADRSGPGPSGSSGHGGRDS